MKKNNTKAILMLLFIFLIVCIQGCGPCRIKPASKELKYSENKEESIKNLDIVPENSSEFDIYEDERRICVIEDKGIINEIISGINHGKVENMEAGDILKNDRTYKSILTTGDGHKIDIYILNDTLYEKGIIAVGNKVVEVDYDIIRYIDSIKEFKNVNLDIKNDAFALFKRYGWTADFMINTMEVRLPQSFMHSAGEYPVKIYWAYNNELSKDIGFDFGNCLGKTVTAEIYRLREPLPEFLKPRKEARGIVIRYEGSIAGAYIDAGRHECFACSLNRKNLEQITGKNFDKWVQGFINYEDRTEVKIAKMQPEEVIKEYFNAVNKHDKNMIFSCLTMKNLCSYLSSNMDNRYLYNKNEKDAFYDGYDNIKSVKLISVKKMENMGNPENILEYEVEADYKFDKPITASDGVQPRFILLRKESGKSGWKIDGVGTGP